MRARTLPIAVVALAACCSVMSAQAVRVLPRGTPAPSLAGLPILPALQASSPHDTLLYADRALVAPRLSDYPHGTGPTAPASVALVTALLAADQTGTGKAELFQYQMPEGLPVDGPPIPLLVAWHGFGTSAANVATQSTLDEECAARGWAYLAVTGIDDKLFGTPLSQQNVEATIRWMLTHQPIDPDRIYMVGFSMGAGAAANFAARHRDPADVMIAGLGLVSGSFDWTQAWVMDPVLQPWFCSAWNFGGPPGQFLFAYQRSSDLHFDPPTYPPTPGTLLPLLAMANNLHATPAFLTWDTGDTLPELPPQSSALTALLTGLGDATHSVTVTGTLNPANGLPASHSWAVLDESALCDFLAPRTCLRRPSAFRAQLDQGGAVSFVRLVQRQAGAFSWLSAGVDGDLHGLQLSDVTNATEVTVAGAEAGVSLASPLRLRASAGGGFGFRVRLTGCDSVPSYAVDTATGSLVTGTESDPSSGSLLLAVPAAGGIDVMVRSVPWGARLSVLPDPGTPGASCTLSLDAPAGASGAWLLIGTAEALLHLHNGLILGVSALPPARLLHLALDAAGHVELTGPLPAGPAMAGLSLPMQAAIQAASGQLVDCSNVFRFDVP